MRPRVYKPAVNIDSRGAFRLVFQFMEHDFKVGRYSKQEAMRK